MATKQEIREWLEACGAKDPSYVIWKGHGKQKYCVCEGAPDQVTQWLHGEHSEILHLLNDSLTGVQGPTFAEWQKAKEREGKVRKMEPIISRAYMSEWTVKEFAHKILDAIEGEA